MVPQLTNGSTKYPYLYTAVQSQTVAQEAVASTECSCSPILLDDTTTVIDGGKIITGSVDANAINADTISGSSLTISSFKDSDNYLNSNIQIGGRNLLLQSQIFGTAEKQKRVVGKYNNNELLVKREDGFNEVQANASFRGISVYVDSMGFAVGDKLVFSTSVRSDSTIGTSLTFYCMAFDASGTRIQTALLHLKTRATQGDSASANIYANNSFQAGAEERIAVEITWLQAAQDLLDAGGNIRFTIQATVLPEVGTNVFQNAPISSATLYVPEKSIEKYHTTEPWSQFGAVEVINTTPSEEKDVWYMITNDSREIPMQQVNMIVAADDDATFAVLDADGNILADLVKRARFVQKSATSIDIPMANEQNMLKSLVNNRLTLIGAKQDIYIYNVSGVQVQHAYPMGVETTVDVSRLVTGIYILKCGQQSFKFKKM